MPTLIVAERPDTVDATLLIREEEWHGSITHDAIAEAMHLAAQALLKHADDFVVASTAS